MQDVSVNKYFDEAMLLELAKNGAEDMDGVDMMED